MLNAERKKKNLAYSPDETISPYFFADTGDYIIRNVVNARVDVTLSMGGLSNVWGGAVLPPTERDTQKWPISVKALEPYYEVINEFLPISSEADGLDTHFYLKHEGKI